MMDTSYNKCLAYLAHNDQEIVCSTKALAWTPDQKLIICCSEKIKIVKVLLVSHYKEPSNNEVTSHITEKCLTLNAFSDHPISSDMLNYRASFPYLNDVERHSIMTDSSLIDSGFHHFDDSKIFKKAVCSPLCNSLNRFQYLISCVTQGYRVFIFVICGSKYKSFECTNLMKEHFTKALKLPMIIKNRNDFEQYISIMHTMSSVDVQWSQLFSHLRESFPPFFLLFTGSRNGYLHAWRVDADFTGRKEQFSWQCCNKHTSEVTSLAWLSRNEAQGLLAVGYVDGSIRVLEITVSALALLCVEPKEIMKQLFEDNLAVQDVAFGQTDKGTSVLLACREHFLALFTVSGSESSFIKHIHFDVGLPLVSLSFRGAHGIVSSQDNTVISLQVLETAEGVEVKQTVLNMTSLPYSDDVPWLCLGVILSPSSSLCFSIHRSDYSLPILQGTRRVSGRQIVVMGVPFYQTMDILSGDTKDIPKHGIDTVMNICLLGKKLLDSALEGPPRLEQAKNFVKTVQESCTEGSQRGLQMTGMVIKFVKEYLKPLGHFEEDLDVFTNRHKQMMENVMSNHIKHYLSLEFCETSKLDYCIKASFQTQLISENQVKDPQRQPDSESQRHCPECAICGTEFSRDSFLTAKCLKGHKTKLCCVSLQPCQDMSTRHCWTCGSCALSIDALTDCSFISEKYNCSLCGDWLEEVPLPML